MGLVTEGKQEPEQAKSDGPEKPWLRCYGWRGKITENQSELCHSSKRSSNKNFAADDRHDKFDRQGKSPIAHTRYRPPVEETQKFHLAALLWLSVISLLLVPMATLLDIPIARNFQADFLPQEVSKMLDLSLIYAHGSGIFLIMLAILMMAPTKRWKMPRLATLALGSGAVATLVKMFVLRPRPNSLKLDLATNEHAWIWSFDWTLSRIAEYDAGMRAFPSGYLATATALTVGLWIVVPRGRPLFLAFCIGTMLQRRLRIPLPQRPVRVCRCWAGLVLHLLPPQADRKCF